MSQIKTKCIKIKGKCSICKEPAKGIRNNKLLCRKHYVRLTMDFKLENQRKLAQTARARKRK